MRSRSFVLLASSIAAAILHAHAAQSGGTAGPVGGSWKIVPSPDAAPEASGNTLLSTVALSPTDAWAVGARPNPTQYIPAPLVVHWNGTKWSIARTPPIAAPRAQLESVVDALLDTPPERRAALFDQMSNGDPHRRAQLERLVAECERPHPLLDHGAPIPGVL